MKHYGDITKMCGAFIEPVDVITAGSPCQDLSVAGSQKGLAGERSGLFMDFMRIVKEMRIATGRKYPKFIIWENVPGAFSSNKGEDFHAVLEELTKLVEPDTTIPRPPGDGKWRKAGLILGSNWSISWRTHDAQYWGVPQRRKRIALVMDFRGHSAPKIQFERQGESRYFAESRTARKKTAADVGGSFNGLGYKAGAKSGSIGFAEELAPTLSAERHDAAVCIQGNIVDRNSAMNGSGISENVSSTLNATDRHCVCMATGQAGAEITENLSPTIICAHEQPVLFDNHAQDSRVVGPLDIAPSVAAKYGTGGGNTPLVLCKPIVRRITDLECERLQGHPDNWTNISGAHEVPLTAYAVDCRNLTENDELSATLQAKSNGGHSLNYQNPVILGGVVRRLTPLECERLQGFPDNWTNVPGASDSKRYKAIGNSIALPYWYVLFRDMEDYLPENPTLGSLFDGIGGFPYLWETLYGKGQAVWASEVDKFAIAVTKERIG